MLRVRERGRSSLAGSAERIRSVESTGPIELPEPRMTPMYRSLTGALVALSLAAVPAAAQSLLQKLQSPDPHSNERFGSDVDIDGAGEWAIIGGPRKFTGTTGRAYLYEHDGQKWQFRKKLTAGEAPTQNDYGHAVAIDGIRAMVAAPGYTDVFGNHGKVYTYVRFPVDSNEWLGEGNINDPDNDPDAAFGTALAMEGNLAAVGAFAGSRSVAFSGIVHIYERGPFGWQLVSTVEANDAKSFSKFGHALSIEDGRVFVGAYGANGADDTSGAVYVFGKSGSSYVQEDKFWAPDGAFGDSFGFDLEASGTSVLVGAHNVFPHGKAYVFRMEPNFFPLPPTWVHEATLSAADTTNERNFGLGVALDGDALAGYTALVGDFSSDTHATQTGAMHRYEQVAGVWTELPKFAAAETNFDDRFGEYIALEGDRLLITARRGDTSQGPFAGEVYAYAPDTLPLSVDHLTLSVSDGGLQTLFLDAGEEHAGKLFRVLGSVSGTSPGTPLLNAVLPLNQDFYFDFTLAHPNTLPLEHSIGFLDAPSGTDTAGFRVLPNSPPSYAFLTLHHAFFVLEGGAVDLVSNPAGLQLLP